MKTICILGVVIAPLFLPAAEGADEEATRLRGKTIRCCDAGGESCVEVPAAEGCAASPTSGPAQPPSIPPDVVARSIEESTAPPEWFLETQPPFLTVRGKLANSLFAPFITDVVIGTIEGEHAFFGESSRSPYSLVTWCTIRVHRSYRGAAVPGELIEVLYDGGSLGQGSSSWPSHGPRCYPFDYGVFALTDWQGIRRPYSPFMFSMIESGEEWAEHHYTRALDNLAPALVGGSP